MSKQSENAGPGVPVGGIGTGGIEFGPDGCFRNVTINNNRWSHERIPLAEGAFTAVWARVGETTTARLMQTASTLPWDSLGLEPPVFTPDALRHEPLYPASIYRVKQPAFPLDVKWEMRALLVPYDRDISSLPLIVATVRFRNPHNTEAEAAALWNWENINGCTATASPAERGPIRPYALPEAPADEEGPPPVALGLVFGDGAKPETNAHGTTYLGGACGQGIRTTVMSWDAGTRGEFLACWNRFSDTGELGNLISRSSGARMGAVSCHTRVPARGEATVRLFFSWHCPRYEINGEDHGNHYASHAQHAAEVVELMLQHEKYFMAGATAWQEALLKSTLPSWLSREMINSLGVLTTNSIYDRDQRFARMESPGAPGVGRLDRSFHGSLPMLLLFPELEERELLLFAREGTLSGESGAIVGQLGEYGFGDGAANRSAPPEELPLILLLACRNALMTGRRVPLQALWPLLRRMLEEAGAMSPRASLEPTSEDEGPSTMAPWVSNRATAWLSGLWVAGLHAAVVLSRHMGNMDDADALHARLQQWLTLFDDELWDEEAGHYRLHTGDGETRHVCHEGQLAGQWYADFLCFGRLFDKDHVQRTLKAIRKSNERHDGVRQAGVSPEVEWPYSKRFPAPGMTWPSHALTQYVCSLIHEGEVSHALEVARRILEGVRRSNTKGWPMRYDLDRQQPIGAESERHVSAPAVWHVYASLTGFFIDMLRQTIWVRPRLPEGVHSLSTPIFTPACMGWLSWQEHREHPYVQKFEITFDSPMSCEALVVRVPGNVPPLQGTCESDMGSHTVTLHAGHDGRDPLVRIGLPAGMPSTESLRLVLRESLKA